MNFKNVVRKTISMGLVCAFLVGVTACGTAKPSEEKETAVTTGEVQATTVAVEEKKPFSITYATTQSRLKEAQKKMAEIIKTEEGITIEFQTVPDPQWEAMLKTKIAAAEVPDVVDINIGSNGSGQFKNFGEVNFVDLSSEPWVNDMTDAEVAKSSDGKILAAPVTTSAQICGAIYNKKVFTDLGVVEPTTYAEYLTLLETIKSKGNGIIPVYQSDKDLWTIQIIPFQFLGQALGEKAKDTYKLLATNQLKWTAVPEFKQMLSDFKVIYDKGYVNKDHLTATYDMAKEAVATGKAAMMNNGDWAVNDIKAKWPDAKIGMFIIPYKDTGFMTSSEKSGFGITVLAAGKQVDNAKKFVTTYMNPKYMDMYFAENPGFPGLKTVNGGNVNEAVKAINDKYITTNKFYYEMNGSFPEWGSWLNDSLWSGYVAYTMGGKSIDEIIKNVDTKFVDLGKAKKIAGF